jgi:hypothetical protein
MTKIENVDRNNDNASEPHWPRLQKILAYIGGALVFCLAIYGAVTLVSGWFDASHGKKAVETVHPFVRGAASAAGEKLKEVVQQTPDGQLEKGSEDISRKMYPLAKGALKGHLEAILKDANRAEVPEKMYQAGKDVSEKVVRPFADGLAGGSVKVLEDVDKTLQGVRKFKQDNQDLLNSIASAVEAVRKDVTERPGLPLPPPPFFPLPDARQPPQWFPQNHKDTSTQPGPSR